MRPRTHIDADPVKFANQREVKKHSPYIGSITPQPGQSVWEFNSKTKQVIIKEPQITGITLSGQTIKKIECLPECLYCVAINRKNAERKFMKIVMKILKSDK